MPTTDARCLSEKSGDPWLFERNARKIKAVVVIGFVLSGLFLLAWPLASYGAIFIFDAPIKGAGDEFTRNLMAYSVWLYPVFWLAALVVAVAGVKKRFRLSVIFIATAFPFLVAATPFLLAALFRKL